MMRYSVYFNVLIQLLCINILINFKTVLGITALYSYKQVNVLLNYKHLKNILKKSNLKKSFFYKNILKLL